MQYLLHSVLRGVQQCAVAPGARRYAGPTVVQVQGRYDQGDMRERLRKISDLPPHVRIVLLGEQADIVAKRQQALEQGAAHVVAIGKTGLPSDDSRSDGGSAPSSAGRPRLAGFSTALAGDWLVSARNARLNWRGLRCAASASCPTVSEVSRLRFAYASALWIRSDLGSSSSSAENCDWHRRTGDKRPVA